jgi:ketosteroid isomerase-like protein
VERSQLEDLVIRFTEAFNRDDLEGALSFVSEGAIYDEVNGRLNRGKQAIREALVPQFRGDYGRIRFQTEDLFVDPDSDKALIRWLCTLENGVQTSAWRGLDILRFEDGVLVEKHTYAKSKLPLIEEKK